MDVAPLENDFLEPPIRSRSFSPPESDAMYTDDDLLRFSSVGASLSMTGAARCHGGKSGRAKRPRRAR